MHARTHAHRVYEWRSAYAKCTTTHTVQKNFEFTYIIINVHIRLVSNRTSSHTTLPTTREVTCWPGSTCWWAPQNCPSAHYLYHPKPQLFQTSHLSFELCGLPRSVNSPPSSSRLPKNEVQWITIRHYLLFWLCDVRDHGTRKSNFLDPPPCKTITVTWATSEYQFSCFRVFSLDWTLHIGYHNLH